MEKKKLCEIAIGKTFKGSDGVERILLDLLPNGTALTLTRDFVYKDTQFDGNSNNYAESSIRRKLETEKLPVLEKTFGADNVIEFEIDLTSDDGLDTYGKIKTKYGLLTDMQYRKYSRLIYPYKVNDWWWLANATSTPERGYQYLVRCVAGGGNLYCSNCVSFNGVRAVCIFKSNIFVSE
jgi:hypothetical protein